MLRFLATPLLLVAVSLVACSPPPKSEEPVRAVKLLQVGASNLSFSTSYAGEVKARVESRLGFRVSGKLVTRRVELGQQVAPDNSWQKLTHKTIDCQSMKPKHS
jgi:multidrug efflux pump subunit AcrA (membrane-fusion protein)